MTIPTDSDGTLPAEQSAAAGPGSLEAELLEAQATAQEHWNSYLRAVAETDNVRKRAQRDVESASRYAIERFAAELLDVRDSLELGVAAGSGGDPARIVEGIGAIDYTRSFDSGRWGSYRRRIAGRARATRDTATSPGVPRIVERT